MHRTYHAFPIQWKAIHLVHRVRRRFNISKAHKCLSTHAQVRVRNDRQHLAKRGKQSLKRLLHHCASEWRGMCAHTRELDPLVQILNIKRLAGRQHLARRALGVKKWLDPDLSPIDAFFSALAFRCLSTPSSSTTASWLLDAAFPHSDAASCSPCGRRACAACSRGATWPCRAPQPPRSAACLPSASS